MQYRMELFVKTRGFWPIEINTDGDSHIKNQALLNSIHKNIEASINQDDDWLQVSVWAFHQALSLFIKGKTAIIFSNEVNYSVYEQMMLENLHGDECWKSELEIYKGLNELNTKTLVEADERSDILGHEYRLMAKHYYLFI